jgi:hypothetical protein
MLSIFAVTASAVHNKALLAAAPVVSTQPSAVAAYTNQFWSPGIQAQQEE